MRLSLSILKMQKQLIKVKTSNRFRAKAVDDYTLEVELEKPVPYF